MTDSDFLSIPADEIASWRTHPVTGAFLAYLNEQFNRLADAALAAVRADKHTEAKVLMGHIDAVQIITGIILGRPPETRTVEDDRFVDPAALWRTSP